MLEKNRSLPLSLGCLWAWEGVDGSHVFQAPRAWYILQGELELPILLLHLPIAEIIGLHHLLCLGSTRDEPSVS